MVLKNYYKILELDTSYVTIDEIKQAYRQVAKKYHPDLNVGDKLAEDRIKDINEAYKVLSIPSSKRKYDRTWNAKFGKGKKAFEGKKQKDVLFNMFLGNIEKTQKQDKKDTSVKGENIETKIDVGLFEAFYGADKQISLKEPDGQAKIITIKIPEGINNGDKIKIIGQGKQGKNGGKNGDLYIKINIQNEKNFKLKGNDIYTDLFLTPWEAALGTKANIQSIDAETNVFIPQGIQTGEVIKIPNRGYKIDKEKRGDLIAEVKVVVPKKLTEEEKDIYEKLSKISKFNPRK